MPSEAECLTDLHPFIHLQQSTDKLAWLAATAGVTLILIAAVCKGGAAHCVFVSEAPAARGVTSFA